MVGCRRKKEEMNVNVVLRIRNLFVLMYPGADPAHFFQDVVALVGRVLVESFHCFLNRLETLGVVERHQRDAVRADGHHLPVGLHCTQLLSV